MLRTACLGVFSAGTSANGVRIALLATPFLLATLAAVFIALLLHRCATSGEADPDKLDSLLAGWKMANMQDVSKRRRRKLLSVVRDKNIISIV